MKQHTEFQQHRGFTLIEVLIAATIAVMVSAGIYSTLRCANILTAKTTAINASNVELQNALGRIQVYLQQSYSDAYPLNSNGTILTSCSVSGPQAYAQKLIPVVMGSNGYVSGTGTGIKFYRYVNGPYFANIPAGGLSAYANSITLTYATGTNSIFSATEHPQPGDILLINTTALQADTTLQAWAVVSGTGASTTANGVTQLTVNLNGAIRSREPEDSTGAITGINYAYDYYRKAPSNWATYLLRPVAFIVSYRNSNTELGLLEPCVTTGSVVNTSSNYTTIATLCSGSSPLLSSVNPSPFAIVPLYGNTFVSVTLQTKTDSDTYLASKQANGFSTYMGISSMIHLKSKPF